MLGYRVLAAGDTALAVEFGEEIDRKISTTVLALARRLNAARLVGIVETVPTFRSLMVHYDPLVLPMGELSAQIGALMQNLAPLRGNQFEKNRPLPGRKLRTVTIRGRSGSL